MELPLIQVEVEASVLASNIDVFRAEVGVFLDGINRAPATDQEFAEAEDSTKALKAAEKQIVQAIKATREKTGTLNDLFSALEESAEEIRAARLDLEKAVKTKKSHVRGDLIREALTQIEASPAGGFRQKVFAPILEASIKGKRTVASITKALNSQVIICNVTINRAQEILDDFQGAHGAELIPDRRDLETWEGDRLEAELRRRLEVAEQRKATAEATAEATKAKVEAEKLRREKIEADNPAPNISEPAPEVMADDGEREELEKIKMLVKDRLGSLYRVWVTVHHPRNLKRVDVFRSAINSAWGDLIK